MSKLTYKARENLSGGAFVFPKERRYPIHDEAHARNALARSSGKSEEARVSAAVHARYPNIGKEKISAVTLHAFEDEMQKISVAIPGGFLHNLGPRIVTAVGKKIGRAHV